MSEDVTEVERGLLQELRAIKPHLPPFGFDTMVTVTETMWDRIIAALTPDRDAALEEAAKVADGIAAEFGQRWQDATPDRAAPRDYDNGRLAGYSDGADYVAKSIRALKGKPLPDAPESQCAIQDQSSSDEGEG